MKDIALERGLPASTDAEKAVLGSVMIDESCYAIMVAALKRSDFFLEMHRRIFDAMQDLNRQGLKIDRITLADRLVATGHLESVGGLSYLIELDSGLPSTANVENYVRIICEKAVMREAVLGAQKLIDRLLLEDGTPGDLLNEATRFMRHMELKIQSTDAPESMKDIASQMDLNNIGKLPIESVQMPHKCLQEDVGGFVPGDLVILGARPSSGKTVLALEAALTAAENGSPAVIFSLEMTKQALTVRAVCNRGQVNKTKLRHGHASEVERLAVLHALKAISELPLYIDDTCYTFSAMAKKVRHMPVLPKLIIIDHLNLMRTPERHENRNNELSRITRELKLFAKEMKVAVLLLSQLNRSSEKENRAPQMSDLRDTGSSEQDGDVVIFLHRKDKLDDRRSLDDPIPVDFILAKQRDGVAFRKHPMKLQGKYCQFVEA